MDSYDGVEKLRLGEVPDPEPGPGQVLLKLKFAALNPADAFLSLAPIKDLESFAKTDENTTVESPKPGGWDMFSTFMR